MINCYDIAYGAGVALAAPYWLIKPTARRKVMGAFAQRMGDVKQREGSRPGVMIHAVSLGEMNATRGLVQRLKELRPDVDVVISATTETGYARGVELYGEGNVIRYPLDFTGAVNRVLERIRPSVVVLMELEAWPNFVLQASRRGVPVVVVNGRITTTSYSRYRLGRLVIGRMFSRLSAVWAQDKEHAERFIGLGARPERVSVTGTMKFDTANVGERVDGAEELKDAVGLDGAGPVWVCGSTGPGEEMLVLGVYRRLLDANPSLRLCIIPRHPQRFGEVATLIGGNGFPLVRRSQSVLGNKSARAVILGDTMGELRKFYALADVVFVGRSLVDLGSRQHGSDMIEPAALGKPVIVGPYTGNFADAMSRFRAAVAMVEVKNEAGLEGAVSEMLTSEAAAREMGERARRVVIQEKGATERHVQMILKYL